MGGAPRVRGQKYLGHSTLMTPGYAGVRPSDLREMERALAQKGSAAEAHPTLTDFSPAAAVAIATMFVVGPIAGCVGPDGDVVKAAILPSQIIRGCVITQEGGITNEPASLSMWTDGIYRDGVPPQDQYLIKADIYRDKVGPQDYKPMAEGGADGAYIEMRGESVWAGGQGRWRDRILAHDIVDFKPSPAGHEWAAKRGLAECERE